MVRLCLSELSVHAYELFECGCLLGCSCTTLLEKRGNPGPELDSRRPKHLLVTSHLPQLIRLASSSNGRNFLRSVKLPATRSRVITLTCLLILLPYKLDLCGLKIGITHDERMASAKSMTSRRRLVETELLVLQTEGCSASLLPYQPPPPPSCF